jgi:hypothetical protein
LASKNISREVKLPRYFDRMRRKSIRTGPPKNWAEYHCTRAEFGPSYFWMKPAWVQPSWHCDYAGWEIHTSYICEHINALKKESDELMKFLAQIRMCYPTSSQWTTIWETIKCIHWNLFSFSFFFFSFCMLASHNGTVITTRLVVRPSVATFSREKRTCLNEGLAHTRA